MGFVIGLCKTLLFLLFGFIHKIVILILHPFFERMVKLKLTIIQKGEWMEFELTLKRRYGDKEQ